MEFITHPISRSLRIEGFNSIYYFEFGKDFSHPPEKHDFWELVYVDSGEIIAVTNGQHALRIQADVGNYSRRADHFAGKGELASGHRCKAS